MKCRARRGSGNVFRQLGFTAREAENLRLRSELMIELCKRIDARGLTQVQAAEWLGVTQPRISDLTRGKIELFSIDGLVEMLGHAGARVTLRVASRKQVA